MQTSEFSRHIDEYAGNTKADINALKSFAAWQRKYIDFQATYAAFLLGAISEDEFETDSQQYAPKIRDLPQESIAFEIDRLSKLLEFDLRVTEMAEYLEVNPSAVSLAMEGLNNPLRIAESFDPAFRQVFDVPTMCFEVVEHRVYTVLCTCGQRHDSVFPSAVSELAQYGPNVRALGVHLTQGQMLPYARASELIREMTGLSVSPATLLAWVGEASLALQGTADLIAQQLHHAPVLCADESGLRVDGKLHWMHVAATAELTWYGMHAKRGLEAIAAHGILPNRLGVLVHDCWAPYWKLNDGLHALCNAHLLRELVYAQEVTGQDWPTDMTELLLNAHRLSAAARQQGKPFDADAIAAFATVYHGIVRQGEELNPPQTKPGAKPGRCKQSDAHNLLRRFRLHADAILRFIADPTVPFTNNIAERAVRMPKVKQKISGCFRTIAGADNFCTIRSCLDTLRKQGHSMLEVLRRAFAGDPIRPAA